MYIRCRNRMAVKRSSNHVHMRIMWIIAKFFFGQCMAWTHFSLFFLTTHYFQASFQYVPPFSEYKYKDADVIAEINRSPPKKLNASLAIQLCYDWIKRNPSKFRADVLDSVDGEDGGLMLHEDIVAGLLECFWPGRCQILQFGNNKYAPYKRQHDHVIIAGVFSFRLYIDGAHTQESIEVCAQWFKEATSKS